MVRLELDLVLYYVPPMVETGNGITLTRTIELPFAPYPDLVVFSKEIDECAEPVGFMIKDLIWDMDREVFLGKTVAASHDIPLAAIPDEVAGWLQRGWRWGSWMEVYRSEEPGHKTDPENLDTADGDDWEEMQRWPSMDRRRRPAHFTKTLQAIIRSMAQSHNNLATAYAMDKTKQFFTEDELNKGGSAAAKRFADASVEFMRLSFDAQCDWREKVLRKYPSLDRLAQ